MTPVNLDCLFVQIFPHPVFFMSQFSFYKNNILLHIAGGFYDLFNFLSVVNVMMNEH